MILPWAAKTGPLFGGSVLRLCDVLAWPRDYAPWVMACMAFESAETFSPGTTNAAGSGATGLIQFMPATAIGLGTTIADLADMSAIGQLAYVQKYFAPYAARVKSLADMYLAILMPKYIGCAGYTPIFSGGAAYRENSGLDANSDGQVTVDEAADRVRAKLARGYLTGFVGDTA